MFPSEFFSIQKMKLYQQEQCVSSGMKVLDFGLAKIIGSKTMTETGMIAGTMYYLPPKSFNGNRIRQEFIDIYSAAIILYEMIAGRHPFEGEDMVSLIYSILNHIPSPPSTLNRNISDDLSQFIMELIDRNLETRLTDITLIKQKADYFNKIYQQISAPSGSD